MRGFLEEISGKRIIDNAEFSGETISGIEIEDKEFHNSKFKNFTLESCTVRNTRFMNCSFTGISFKNADLTGVEFINCSFSNLSISTSKAREGKIINSEISSCTIESSSILNFLFTGKLKSLRVSRSNLEKNIFKNCAVENITLLETKISSFILHLSSLKSFTLTSVEISDGDLGKCEALKGVLKGCVLSSLSCEYTNFRELNLQDTKTSRYYTFRCNFHEVFMRNVENFEMEGEDCEVSSINIAELKDENGKFILFRIKNGTISKVSMHNSNLISSSVEELTVKDSFFLKSEISHTHFSKCKFISTEITNSIASTSILESCDTDGLNFKNSVLPRIVEKGETLCPACGGEFDRKTNICKKCGYDRKMGERKIYRGAAPAISLTSSLMSGPLLFTFFVILKTLKLENLALHFLISSVPLTAISFLLTLYATIRVSVSKASLRGEMPFLALLINIVNSVILFLLIFKNLM